MGFRTSLEVQRERENKKTEFVDLHEFERELDLDELLCEVVQVIEMENHGRLWRAHWVRGDAFPGKMAQYVLELQMRGVSDHAMGEMEWGDIDNNDQRVKELGLLEVMGEVPKEDDRKYKIVVDVVFDDEGQRWVVYLFDETEEETGKSALEFHSFQITEEVGAAALAFGLAKLYREGLEPLFNAGRFFSNLKKV